jgi:Carboxypeptidase regulatory-like domain
VATLVMLFSNRSSRAQDGGITATLRGAVDDTSGAVLPGAQVTLTNTGTSTMQTVVTDDRGEFVFSGLWPGACDMTIWLTGFKTSEQRGLVLSPDDTRGLDVTLERGSQQQRVVVTSDATSCRLQPARAKASSLLDKSRTCRSSAVGPWSCCASSPALWTRTRA